MATDAAAATTVIATPAVGINPHGVAANPVTNRIYVANITSNTVSVIDSASNTVITNISVGNAPFGVAVNRLTNRVYVVNASDNTVSVIDGATNTVIGAPIGVGTGPEGVAVNESTNRVYVANFDAFSGNTVSVIDGTGPGPGTFLYNRTVGTGPNNVVANPVTNRVYVTNIVSGDVSVIDGGAGDAVFAIIPGVPTANGADIDTVTNRLYVANTGPDTLTVIDGNTNGVITTLAVGPNPHGVTVNALGNRVYVSNDSSGTVSVVNAVTNVVEETVTVGSQPRELAFNRANRRVYVANFGSNNVSVLADPSACCDLATAAPGGIVTVTGSGRFKLRFNELAGGGIDRFYDRFEDAGESLDLAGGEPVWNMYPVLFYDALWYAFPPPGTPWYGWSAGDGLTPDSKLDVLEATRTRVKIRQESFYHYTLTQGRKLRIPGMKGHGDYSIQGVGRLALRWKRQASAAVDFGESSLDWPVHSDPGQPPLDNWTAYNKGGPLTAGTPDVNPLNDDFMLIKSDYSATSPNVKTDFLVTLSKDWPEVDATEWQDFAGTGKARLASWSDGGNPPSWVAGQSQVFNFLTSFRPTNLGDTAMPWADADVTTRASDYRIPAAISLTQGFRWVDDDENTPLVSPGDFFNESEAAYVFDLSTTQGLIFDLAGSLAAPRYEPFFKIRQWRSLNAPPSASLGGATLARDVDFRADVKPVSRAHWAPILSWHCPLQDLTTANTCTFGAGLDVGTGGSVSGGTAIVPARYGNGAQFLADGDSVTAGSAGSTDFSPFAGAVEFWYQPFYPHDDTNRYLLWYNQSGSFPNFHCFVFEKTGVGELRLSVFANYGNQVCTAADGDSVVSSVTIPSTAYGWRAGDWVHLQTSWTIIGGIKRLRILVDGVEVGFSAALVAPVEHGPTVFGGCTGATCPPGGPGNANGIIDEPHIYAALDGNDEPATRIGYAGLRPDGTEYLADWMRNFTMNFSPPVDASLQGTYLYIGTDSKFRGLNVLLEATGAGVAAGALEWQYWNGVSGTWDDLESGTGFTDTTDSFTKRQGTVYWTTDPAGWAAYSVNGGPDLYYVRVRLPLGSSYGLVPPVESLIKTDILLFQYCGDITTTATFEFPIPTATAVDLLSFEATGLDGAVELAWRTGSEIDNLGFYLYRADSPSGPFARITPAPIPGLGSSPVGASYRYLDHSVVNGRTYYYLLEDFESTGRTERHGPVSAAPQAGAPSPGGEGEADPGGETDPGSSDDSRIAFGDPTSVSLRVLERTERGLLLELTTGGFFAATLPDGSVRLAVPGFTEDNSPGSPAIPTRRAWLEATAGRQVQVVSVRALDVSTFPNLRPLAAETREILAPRDGTVQLARRRVAEGAAFAKSRLYPEQPALLLQTAFQGETKKALLELAPLRWDPASRHLVLARRLLVQLAFTGKVPGETSRGGSRGRSYTERASHRNRGPLARLATRSRGLYALRFEDLFDPYRRGLDTSRLRLSRQGLPVAFHVEPNPARFGPGSTLYFLSDGASLNPYGAEAVYELELDQAPGLVMTTGSAAPHGPTLPTYLHRLEREENLFFASQLDPENLWPWASILASTTRSFPSEISRLAPSAETARLELWVLGLPGPDSTENHVRLFVNGQLVAEPSWTSRSLETLSFALSPTLLLEGTNTLAIENAGSAYSALVLDRFAITYPRLGEAEAGVFEGRFSLSGAAEVNRFTTSPFLLDISEPSPRWLTGTECSAGVCRFRAEAGRRYFATETALRPSVELVSPGWLKSTANRYDYVVIGPQALLEAAEPLLQHRRGQGLATLAVPLEDVFDEFGFGEPSPHAIRDFLAYAFHRWAPPAPRYVLLLGDATYDYKDFLHTGTQNQLPPILFKSSYLWTASDSLYASVNGTDALPDLAIGRLPASTPEEAQTLVAKILAFESAGLTLDGPAVLVSDNPDRAGDFQADADEIASTILASRNPSRISLAQMGTDPTRTAILDAFNRGPSLLSYVGHGGTQLWAHENIFNASQIGSLEPQALQPLVLTMNCLNGYFQSPYSDSLAEEMVKAEGKGAIAAFSPTGLGLNDQAHVFHKALLTELTQGDHHRLGDAVLAAQAAYANSGALPEIIAIYHLFGDPALKVR